MGLGGVGGCGVEGERGGVVSSEVNERFRVHKLNVAVVGELLTCGADGPGSATSCMPFVAFIGVFNLVPVFCGCLWVLGVFGGGMFMLMGPAGVLWWQGGEMLNVGLCVVGWLGGELWSCGVGVFVGGVGGPEAAIPRMSLRTYAGMFSGAAGFCEGACMLGWLSRGVCASAWPFGVLCWLGGVLCAGPCMGHWSVGVLCCGGVGVGGTVVVLDMLGWGVWDTSCCSAEACAAGCVGPCAGSGLRSEGARGGGMFGFVCDVDCSGLGMWGVGVGDGGVGGANVALVALANVGVAGVVCVV